MTQTQGEGGKVFHKVTLVKFKYMYKNRSDITWRFQSLPTVTCDINKNTPKYQITEQSTGQ